MKKFLVELVNRSSYLVPLVAAVALVLGLGSAALIANASNHASAPKSETVSEETVAPATVSPEVEATDADADAHFVYFSTPLEYGLVCAFYGESLTEAPRDCVVTESVNANAIQLTDAFTSAQLMTADEMDVIYLTYGEARTELYIPLDSESIAD